MRKEFIERADISYLLIEMQQANALIPLLLRKVLISSCCHWCTCILLIDNVQRCVGYVRLERQPLNAGFNFLFQVLTSCQELFLSPEMAISLILAQQIARS